MSPDNLKLIVNADDFGLATNINDGILYSHLNGIVTSTSIVAQGSAFEQAVEITENNPTLDVGIHLTLVEEHSVLNPVEIPSIVNSDGRFFSHAKDFFRKYLFRNISKEEVYKELDAQINKVLSHGIKISHIDSHQHLHVLKDIFDISIKLAEIYNIPAIRVPFEPIKSYMFTKDQLSRIVSLKVLNFISKQRKKEDIICPENFSGFIFGGNLNKKNLLTILHALPENGICEVMCHPGFDDSYSKYSHWKYNWESELKAITDPDISKFIRKKKIELINFKDIIGINKTMGT